MNKNDVQARGWCLTINNPVDSDYDYFEFLSKSDIVLYLSAQLEVGKQGTKHIQAFVEFKTPRRFTNVKNLFPLAHIEKRRGTSHEAFKYCLKLEGRAVPYWSCFSETVPKTAYSAQKTGYELCRQYDTLGQFQLHDEFVYLKYQKYINAYYLNLSRVPKLRDLQVIVLVGATGVGKTSYVYENEEFVYVKDHTQGWDGYVGQEAVFVDEFSAQWSIEYILLLLQGRPMNLQIKGGYVPALYKRIYIATNLSVEDWYSSVDERQKKALYRRFSVVLTRDEFNLPGKKLFY